MAVRCYRTNRIDGHHSHADIPRLLLHHPTLQCLVIDATSKFYISDGQVPFEAPVLQLKLLAITGGLSPADLRKLTNKTPQLQHLCVRASMLSLARQTHETCHIDVAHLAHLRVLELGFPIVHVNFTGMEHLHKLSAVLLCGMFGAQKPTLPEALADAPDEVTGSGHEFIARRALVPGTNERHGLTEAMRMEHRDLVIQPLAFIALVDHGLKCIPDVGFEL